MAFLARTRIVSKVVKIAPVICQRQRPLLIRQMMTVVPKTSGTGRLDDILDVIVKQRNEMEELREQIEELERKNEELQARVDEFEEEEAQSSSGIDRDTLEEKLDALDEKLDEAKDLVDEIRNSLQ
jgi:predicted RNase H-like nuclease (RuvC/YqgF family)